MRRCAFFSIPLLLAALVLSSTSPASADGGVTFTNIAEDGGAGITFERFETPARQAIQDSFYNNAPIMLPFPGGLLPSTPQKGRGAPGVGLFDFDGDDDLDIYVTNGPGHDNSLYENRLNVDGTFVDVAAAAGVGIQAQDSSGVCFGDLDNDGDNDLYVTGIAQPNVLFRNNGNGTFTDITAAAGVGAGNFHHSGCALADFNGDGFLDLLVGNSHNWNHRRPVFINALDPSVEPNQLFLRDAAQPGIVFADVSATSGIRNLTGLPDGRSFTWAVSAVDYDQDGDTDIIWADTQGAFPQNASQIRGVNKVLNNDGTGQFTDVTNAAGIGGSWGSWMGLSYGDYNCDGNIDFFSTNLGHWVGSPVNATRWFLGTNGGGFTDAGTAFPLPFGWGTSTADYDNDADQDIIYYGDDDLLTLISTDNPGTILQNQSCNAQFVLDLGALTTDHRLREVNGVAMGDLNADGFEDIVTVAMFQIVPVPGFFRPWTSQGLVFGSPLDGIAAFELIFVGSNPPGQLILLQPFPDLPNGDLAVEINSGGNGNGAVNLELVGGKGIVQDGRSNRSGIGAVVRFTPDGGETAISPMVGGGSHASQDSLIVHFGLGAAPKGTVDVLWPGGTRNRLYDVAAGERLAVPEIPCSFDGSWKNFGQYNSCVRTALNRYMQTGVIDAGQRQRLIDSAVRAFNEQ